MVNLQDETVTMQVSSEVANGSHDRPQRVVMGSMHLL